MKLLPRVDVDLVKTLRPDLNERALFLTRSELCGVYGRSALRFALREARAVRDLDPLVRERFVLERRRTVLSNEKAMLAKRVTSIDLKARVRGEETPELSRARTGVSDRIDSLTRQLSELDAGLAGLRETIRARRSELVSDGINLDEPKVAESRGWLTPTERMRLEFTGGPRSLLRTLEEEFVRQFDLFDARVSGRYRSLRDPLRKGVLPTVELLALSSGERGDLFARAVESTQRALRLLFRFLESPFLKNIEELAAIQLFEELVKVSVYPGYRGEVAVGYGGSRHQPNVRAAAYLLPALKILDAFRSEGLRAPRLRVIIAHELGIAMNGIPADVARLHARTTVALLRGFIERFYPAEVSNVQFTTPTIEDFVESPVFETALSYLTEFARAHSENKQLGSLLKKAWRHAEEYRHVPLHELSSEQRSSLAKRALSYVAGHIVEAGVGDVRLAEDGRTKPDYMIKVGGSGEDDFNFFENVAANIPAFDACRDGRFYRPNTSGLLKGPFRAVPIHLTATVGTTPPYYWASEDEVAIDALGDVTFPELLTYYRSDSKLRAVVGDLEAITVADINGGAYLQFLRDGAAVWG